MARDARRYNERHDNVLKAIAAVIEDNIPSTAVLVADINTHYTFPLNIVSTDLRPDLVWWDESQKYLNMAELTICFEINFEDAALRKSAKYAHIVEQAITNGFKTKLITLQVGSRGSLTSLDLKN